MSLEPRILGGGELGGWLWRYWWMKLEILALGNQLPDDPIGRFLHIVSLGRFPETGNITDLYALSVPLDWLFGHPDHYNAKVFLILFANALAAYAYTLYLTGRRGVALIAGVTFACNTFVFYEVQRSGLRQALLCFIPLFALFLDRMLAERKVWLGIVTGLIFAATAVFYWFFGLFMAMYAAMRFGAWLLEHRTRHLRALVWPIVVSVVVAGLVILPFMMPYLSSTYQDPSAQGLPQVTYGEDFPSLKVLQNAPLRPDDKKSNFLASLARVLTSSWRVDWAFNPLQSWVVPAVMAVFAVGVGLLRFRRTAFWLLLFTVFYSLTWGPYLHWNEKYVMIDGEYAVRLPYWYAFKVIPMMSRLFAPYRMGAVAVFALTVLLALNLAALSARLERWRWVRPLLGVLFVALYLGQFMADPMRERGIGSNRMIPLPASEVTVPSWYYQLAQEKGRLGIIELPLNRQQDLLSYYQVTHGKKVLSDRGGWVTPGALPPILRDGGKPDPVTSYLRWLSRPDGLDDNPFVVGIRNLNEMPYRLSGFAPADLTAVYRAKYRYVVLHELGCYMMQPQWGKDLYVRIRKQLQEALGDPVTEFVEMAPTADSEEMIPIRNGMAWVPSIYSPLLIPEPRPFPLRMVVFAIPAPEGTAKSGEGTAKSGEGTAGTEAKSAGTTPAPDAAAPASATSGAAAPGPTATVATPAPSPARSSAAPTAVTSPAASPSPAPAAGAQPAPGATAPALPAVKGPG